ncbi:MAG: hypothetical protein GXO22_07085 [Aquificae bacterium]|nr:hypothetical protein [Aquificota bacterium]
MKKLVFGLVFVGFLSCTDEDSPNAYRYEVFKALDRGEYDTVIQLLENEDKYQKAFSFQELNINLAAAYIGKAGYDISSIINDVLDSDIEGDAFKVFSQAISKKASGSSLIYLNKAVEKYSKILDNVSCEDLDTLSQLQKDACFLKGLVETAKGTTSFVLVLEENPEQRTETIENWLNGVYICSEYDINGNNVPDDLEATACALEYANTGNCYVYNSSLSFDDVEFNKEGKIYSYTLLTIDINPDAQCQSSNPNTFYKLISDTDVVITDGYCDTAFESCTKPDGVSCFPCPVIDNDSHLTVGDTVVDAINNGIDAVLTVIPDYQDSDVEENLREFKEEICLVAPSDCICDGIPCSDAFHVQTASVLEITQKALANYLMY